MTVRVSDERPETFTAAGNTFTILDDGRATDGRIGLFECRLAPGWVGPPQHVHTANDETWFVLAGAVRFDSGDDTSVVGAGRLVTATRGVAHTFANADADAEALLLCTVSPADYIDYFRALTRMRPGADGRFDSHEMGELMRRFATVAHRPVAASQLLSTASE